MQSVASSRLAVTECGDFVDMVTLSVLASAFAGIAEEMGTLLVRSAYSSNIKERRDCSAALFDTSARMIA